MWEAGNFRSKDLGNPKSVRLPLNQSGWEGVLLSQIILDGREFSCPVSVWMGGSLITLNHFRWEGVRLPRISSDERGLGSPEIVPGKVWEAGGLGSRVSATLNQYGREAVQLL